VVASNKAVNTRCNALIAFLSCDNVVNLAPSIFVLRVVSRQCILGCGWFAPV